MMDKTDQTNQTDKTNIYIGLMSGTSMDGVDVVLVDFSHAQPKLLASMCFAMPKDLKHQIEHLISPHWIGSLSEIGVIDQKLGKWFAEAVQQLLHTHTIDTKQVHAIGSHGQTVWHQPRGEHPFTLQLGDPSQIAEHCNISTVADFRRMDMAAGGQGAPLVPAFHQQILAHPTKNRIIVNIGGIANITILAAQNKQKKFPVIGFDTGPGNGLMDAWIKRHQNCDYDENGAWARSGTINYELLMFCLQEPYFLLHFPKSTGKEHFNLAWLEKCYPALDTLPPADVQATLVELTVQTLSQEIIMMGMANDVLNGIDEILLCGGGYRNQFLIERLRNYINKIKPTPIHSTEIAGLHPDWVEAIAFAWLAKQTMQAQSGNLAAVTGAKGARILGAIHQVIAP
jgi:anhydro-N-acetylmuramic acid kinase